MPKQLISKRSLIKSDVMREFFSNSEKETKIIAEKVAKDFSNGGVVAFRGGMGMGKTAFIRGLVRGLNNSSFVSSPTFAIVNDYGGKPHVFHFDMYRVNTWDDLYSTGFFDYMDNGSLLLIEWSENIEEALPEETVYIEIEKGEAENQRIIRIYGKDFSLEGIRN